MFEMLIHACLKGSILASSALAGQYAAVCPREKAKDLQFSASAGGEEDGGGEGAETVEEENVGSVQPRGCHWHEKSPNSL